MKLLCYLKREPDAHVPHLLHIYMQIYIHIHILYIIYMILCIIYILYILYSIYIIICSILHIEHSSWNTIVNPLLNIYIYIYVDIYVTGVRWAQYVCSQKDTMCSPSYYWPHGNSWAWVHDAWFINCTSTGSSTMKSHWQINNQGGTYPVFLNCYRLKSWYKYKPA